MSLRSCLKIVNWYVRDRQMQSVLRTSLLTAAQSPISERKWKRTENYLKTAFGVGKEISSKQIGALEVYRKVEYSRLADQQTKAQKRVEKLDQATFNEIEGEFSQEWRQIVYQYSIEKNLVLVPIFSETASSVITKKKDTDIIDGLIGNIFLNQESVKKLEN